MPINIEWGPNAGPDAPRFNPNGALRKVAMHAAPILSGQAYLLTEAADPRVAELLVHTGEVQRHTLPYLRRRAQLGFDGIFGTNSQTQAVVDGINKVHANKDFKRSIVKTTGAIEEGTPYSPMTQESFGLVGATLIEGSIEGYEKFVGDLSASEKDDYTKEALEYFGMMGLKPDSLPATYDGIRTHIDAMIADQRLAVGDAAMSLMPYIMLEYASVPNAIRQMMRLFSLDMLDPRLLAQYGLKISPGERRIARRRAEDIKKALPHIPAAVKYNPQFLVAQRRENGEEVTPWQAKHPRLYSLLHPSRS